MYRPQLYKILDSVFNKAIKCCTQWIYGVYKEVELGANVTKTFGKSQTNCTGHFQPF